VAQEPPSPQHITRRRLLRLWGPAAAAGVALGGVGGLLYGRTGRHRPPGIDTVGHPPDWRTPGTGSPALAVAGGSGPATNLRRALDGVGGVGRFIGSGERVVVKPNCAWDRTAEQAANTNPELVAELVRVCIEAGAASVVVAENTCHDPDRVFDRSGVAAAARAAGAKVVHQKTTKTVPLDLGGTVLGTWEVLRPIADADRVINVPIVKHHSLCRATLGMKNWMGAVVGRRNSLHQNINQVCAELCAAFRPTLTVVDATRVLTGGGPTGGSLDLVRPVDRIAVSTDPVAADSWAGSLLELEPHQLRFLTIAERLSLGTPNWNEILVEV
jgi:uncharacterized protein (DUF362 family)